MRLLMVVLTFIIVAPLILQNGATLSACAAGGNTPQGQILSGAAAAGNCNTTTLPKLAKTIVNILSIVLGIVAVIMVILGGFRYVTSAGDAGKVQQAKSTLIYALIGLVIAALAQLIVKYVFNKAVNAS